MTSLTAAFLCWLTIKIYDLIASGNELLTVTSYLGSLVVGVCHDTMIFDTWEVSS